MNKAKIPRGKYDMLPGYCYIDTITVILTLLMPTYYPPDGYIDFSILVKSELINFERN